MKSISCYTPILILLLSPSLLFSYTCPSGGISSQIKTCSTSDNLCYSSDGILLDGLENDTNGDGFIDKDECEDQDGVYVNPSDKFSVNLSLLATGQFTLNAWFDENVNLWTIGVNNDGATMPDGSFPNYALKFELRNSAISSEPLVSAFYVGEDLGSTEILFNSDFSGGGSSSICDWQQNTDFRNTVESIGLLPQGDYSLTLTLYPQNTAPSEEGAVEWCNFGSNPSVTEVLSNNLVSTIELTEPPELANVSEMYPWFRWYSPGFRQGVNINYRLIVSQYNPLLHGSRLDAINDLQLRYFDSKWDYPGLSNILESGDSQQISVKFPSGDRDLACGYEYVWRVQARETIANETPIWGWEEGSGEVYSPPQSFYFGSKITADNVFSPPTSASAINTILPVFNLESVWCASEYEIWVSNSDDPEVENPIWQSDALPNPQAAYPDDAIALKPGERYFWKIRLNPDDPSPWSEIFSFNTEFLDLSQPSDGEILETVLPSFMVTAPNGIASYELRISDSNDPMVESANIFSKEVVNFPYEFPSSSDIGLLADETYFWKVVALNKSGNIIGDIDDYNDVKQFKIGKINLSTPADNMASAPLNPFFDWDGPTFSNYKFYLDDDISFDSPILSQIVGTNSFLQYPENLEPGTAYYWKIQAVDEFGSTGRNSTVNMFTTGEGLQSDQVLNLNQQIDFDVEVLVENNEPTIVITLAVELENTNEYLAVISENASFSQSQEYEIPFGVLNFKADDWSKTYYIKIKTNSGDLSDVVQVLSPDFPGSDEQVAIDVGLESGSLQPQISISQSVTGSLRYFIKVSSSNDFSSLLFTQFLNESDILIYPTDAPSFEFGQTYYIQCSANIDLNDDASVHGLPSEVFVLFIPNIVPPVGDANSFSWSKTVPESDAFQFQISFVEDFTTIEYNQDGLSSKSIDFNTSDLEPGTSYYWRVRGVDDGGNPFGSWSSPMYFETEGESALVSEGVNVEEVQVEIESPSDGEEVTSTNPVFSWKEVVDAEKYEIVVSKDSEFNEIMWLNQNIALTSVEYPTSGAASLESGVKYFWRVRAFFGELSVSQYSPAFSFIATNDNTPVLTGPLSQSESILPFFSWDRVKDAEKYLLVISSNEGMSAIILEKNDISDVQFQYSSSLAPLEYSSTYYWTVTALDIDLQPIGNASSVGSFTTPTGEIELEFNYGED